MSKKLRFVWLVVAWLAFSCSVVNAEAPAGWYASLHIGTTSLENSNIAVSSDTDFGAAVDYSQGLNVGGSIGYKLRNHFRIEGEITFRDNDLDSVLHTNDRSSESGELSQINLMANILYDVSFLPFLDMDLTPYFGGGLGFTAADLDNFIGPNAAISLLTDNDSTVFAGQFIAGVSYELSDTTYFNVDYRYFASDDLGFKDLSGKFNLKNGSHNLTVGMRYHFW